MINIFVVSVFGAGFYGKNVKQVVGYILFEYFPYIYITDLTFCFWHSHQCIDDFTNVPDQQQFEASFIRPF